MKNLNFFFPSVYILFFNSIESNNGLCELSVWSPWSSSQSSLQFCNLHNFYNPLTLLLQITTMPENIDLRIGFWGSLCFPKAETDSLILVFLFP